MLYNYLYLFQPYCSGEGQCDSIRVLLTLLWNRAMNRTWLWNYLNLLFIYYWKQTVKNYLFILFINHVRSSVC
jgi:hypothetical protein